ncbi:hypothetical protein [Pyrobaculum aerophilum]|uniref:hypothetical protein n=1 Tax=Pyrobaculum aerophilum TaxID=13773 RepID=UPI0023F1D7AA|nr:hypothetical protein [Pyrobaculum aerophilum]MCX8136768.1 hypothetical protein [Pyrobaculum aerophilum]
MIWLGVELALLVQYVVDRIVAGIVPWGGLLAVVGIASAITLINFLSEYKANVLLGEVTLDLSHRMVVSAIKSGGGRGEVLSRISGDVLNAAIYLFFPVDVAVVLARLAAQLAASFYISPVLTLTALPLIALYFYVVRRVGPAFLAYAQRERLLYSAWFKRAKEVVDGAHSLYRMGVRELPGVLLKATAEWLSSYKKLQLYSKSLNFGASAIAFAAPHFARLWCFS